jgi:tetratricopeptide (TPR) repeat protein
MAGGAAAQGLSGAYLAGRHAAATGDVAAAARGFAEALEADQGNTRLMELAVFNLLAAGDVTGAAPIAARLVQAAPQHRIGNLALVVESIAEGRFEGALSRLQNAPEAVYPLLGRLLEAWSAAALGEDAAADAALAALDQRDVFALFGDYHRGLIRAFQGDHEAAAEAYAKALSSLQSPTTRFALAYGATLETLGRGEEAAALYRRAGAGPLGDPAVTAALARLEAGAPPEPIVTDAVEGAAEALFGVASVFANDNGRRVAMVYARLATALRPDHVEARLIVARLFEELERHDLALAAYDAAPADTPYRARLAIGRAEALYELDRVEAATEALRALALAQPESFDIRNALADHLRRTEQWEACAEAYGAAIDILAQQDIENWALFYQRGICHERAGLWNLAEPDFRKALALEPDQPYVLNYLGYSLVEQRRNLDEARAMIERAVELRPEDGYITDSLGWVLYRTGDYAGAVEWLEKAVELAPYDPVINDHLGDALWMVGRRLEAAFQWRRARSLDPEPEELERIKRKLDVGLDAVLADEAALETGAADAEAPNGG